MHRRSSTFYKHISNPCHKESFSGILPLCFFMALTLSVPSSAQITIENTVFPAVGDTLHYAFGNQPGAILQIYTPPGGDQHWDLSNLQPTQTWDQIMLNPQSGTAVAAFHDASLLYHPLNSNDEVYLKVTGTQVIDLGYYGHDKLGLGLNLLFKNAPGYEQSWAPVNFFDIHQSAANTLTAFDAPIAPPILLALVPTADSFRIRNAYQKISAIDAWGTLTIPGGTFEVLRKKQTEYTSTAVDVKVAPLGWIDIATIGGQSILPLGVDTVVTFHFLNNISKEAIAICTLNTAQNEVTGVQYKAVSPPVGTKDISEAQEPIRLYPNPAQHCITLQWELPETADVRILVSDVTGSQVSTLLDKRVSAGPQLTRLDLPPLVPGLHFIQVYTNGAFRYSANLFIL